MSPQPAESQYPAFFRIPSDILEIYNSQLSLTAKVVYGILWDGDRDNSRGEVTCDPVCIAENLGIPSVKVIEIAIGDLIERGLLTVREDQRQGCTYYKVHGIENFRAKFRPNRSWQ